MKQQTEFGLIAALVRSGEWTTYGDIAEAAGSPRSARAVGHEAAMSDDFPNAHRVLRHDGTIARQRTSETTRARNRLEAEGVNFDKSGRADPVMRIYWDELQRRVVQRGKDLKNRSSG